MHPSTWKRRERIAAKFFGTVRNVGSGSQGRSDKSRSDSIHPHLFLSSKASDKSPLWDLWHGACKVLGGNVGFNYSCRGSVLYVTHSKFANELLTCDAELSSLTVVAARSAIHTLFDEERAKADIENKLTVLCIHKLNVSGFLIVFAATDLDKLRGIYRSAKN